MTTIDGKSDNRCTQWSSMICATMNYACMQENEACSMASSSRGFVSYITFNRHRVQMYSIDIELSILCCYSMGFVLKTLQMCTLMMNH